MKIAVYAIAKNEGKHAARWARSAQDADAIVLVDTGSTDATIAEAVNAVAPREVAADMPRMSPLCVHSITVSPWRFDDARTAALALVPRDIDWCIVLDLDEVLVTGWRARLEAAIERAPDATRCCYSYVWSWQTCANCGGTGGDTGACVRCAGRGEEPAVRFRAKRIHRRHGWRWVQPCHEELVPWDGLPEVGPLAEVDDAPLIEHHADDSKSRSDYLPLLEIAAREQPQSARAQLYLRRERLFRLHGELGAAGMVGAYIAFAREAASVGCNVEAAHALTLAWESATSEERSRITIERARMGLR